MRAPIPLLPEDVALFGGSVMAAALVLAFWKFASLKRGKR